MRHLLAGTIGMLAMLTGMPTLAQTVYPLDRAEILIDTKFDFKVEFPGLTDPAQVSVLVNGETMPRPSARKPPSSNERTARINRRCCCATCP